jgi:hypothetical protein
MKKIIALTLAAFTFGAFAATAPAAASAPAKAASVAKTPAKHHKVKRVKHHTKKVVAVKAASAPVAKK